MRIKFEVKAPGIPGQDLRFPTKKQADREAENVRRTGQTAEVVEVLLLDRVDA